MEQPFDIFWALVKRHYGNLQACLPIIIDGRTYLNGTPLEEGLENDRYKGFLIVSNGQTLVDKLVESEVLLQEDIDGFVDIPDEKTFLDRLKAEENNDGAFLYDAHNKRITRVYEFKNHPLSNLRLSTMVPDDFVFYEETGAAPIRRHLGTKTRLAIRLPQIKEDGSIEAFQIKRSAYNPLGLGKVTHFNKDGLAEEFFFKYAPGPRTPYLISEQPIIGVYRGYKRSNNELVRSEERLVSPSEITL